MHSNKSIPLISKEQPTVYVRRSNCDFIHNDVILNIESLNCAFHPRVLAAVPLQGEDKSMLAWDLDVTVLIIYRTSCKAHCNLITAYKSRRPLAEKKRRLNTIFEIRNHYSSDFKF